MSSTDQTLEVTASDTKATESKININGENGAAVRVWLVDDNDQFRTLVADALGRGHGIDCARQFASPDALLSELASKAGPDVILLDVQMGEQSGLDAVRPIKSLTRSTRVLMFTTFYDPKSRERALNDGASDYLLKTEPLGKLIECIRRPAEVTTPLRRPREQSKYRQSGNRQSKSAGGNADDAPPPSLLRALKRLRSFWN